MTHRLAAVIAGVSLIATGLLVPGAVEPAGAAPHHTWTDLGTLGGVTSDATAVNEAGVVVGVSKNAGGQARAFRWTSGTGMTDLGTLGGATSEATDVNDAGAVVGSAVTAASESHAFRWTAGGGMTDLGTLGGTSSRALLLSESGAVAGTATIAGTTHGFYWDPTHGTVDLGGLGGTWTVPEGLNDSGVVVGTAGTAAGEARAFRWTLAGGITDLGTLGGEYSRGAAVSDSGVVAGTADVVSGGGFSLHGFRWTAGGGMVDLGPFGWVAGINEAGVVAGAQYGADADAVRADPVLGLSAVGLGPGDGASNDAVDINSTGTILGGMFRVYLADPEGGVELLAGPAGFLRANDLNDAGQVAGSWADNPEPWFNGVQHAFLWSPTNARSVSVSDASVVEGDGGVRKVAATVTLSSPATSAVRVKFVVLSSGYGPPGSAATDESEFTPKSRPGTVTFRVKPTGLTGTSAVVTAKITGDAEVESDEHFAIVLSGVTGPAVLGTSRVPVTILDDDPGSGAMVGIGDVGIWEGDAGSGNVAQVALSLRSSVAVPVSVRVTIGAGSATPTSDFRARSLVVRFPAGVVTKLVPVTVFSDAVAEGDETASVTLSAPSVGLAIGRGVGTVTVHDDDL